MSAHLWVLCCSSAPCVSIAGHIEYVEHFRMSISYTLYYNKITRQWNMLNSHLNKCSSVKYILTYHLLVWKWRTIKSRQACMEVSTNVNTFVQCLEKFDSFKNTLVWIHLAALPSCFFFPRSFLKDKKVLCVKWGLFYTQQLQVWAEKWLVGGPARSWRQCGFAGQCVRHPPLLVHCDFSKHLRGRSLGQSARNGQSPVLAVLLGLKGHAASTPEVYQPQALPAGSSLICNSSNSSIK